MLLLSPTEDGVIIDDAETCHGNCFGPQPMGKTSEYIPNYPVMQSPLQCVSRAGESSKYEEGSINWRQPSQIFNDITK